MADRQQRVVGQWVCAQVPVSADLEDGFGATPECVAATISATLASGSCGGNIEDFTGDRAQPLYDFGLSVERIRAARAAADSPFVLVGHTDVLLVGGGLDEAVRRANAYLAAGADCAFVPGAADAATIGRLVRELDGPLNVVTGLSGNALSLDDLRELGVRRVTVGGIIARSMYRQLLNAARELAEQGTFTYADDQVSQNDPQRHLPGPGPVNPDLTTMAGVWVHEVPPERTWSEDDEEYVPDTPPGYLSHGLDVVLRGHPVAANPW